MKHKPFSIHTPEVLVLFITGRCNSRCRHCFYSEQLNQNNDALNLGIVHSIIGSLSRPTAITLTGGEPFIRDDLSDIVGALLSSADVKSISIMSNGLRPRRLKNILSFLLPDCNKPIHVQLSLDGNETIHENIRSVPGGYNKIITSAQWLSEAASVWQYLSYVISITVMGDNIAEVPYLVADLFSLGLNSKITFVRGNSFSTFGVPREILNQGYQTRNLPAHVDQLEELVNCIERSFPNYFSDTHRRKLEAALYTLRYKKRFLRCLAGSNDGVIYHDGSVGICEQVKPFANLSDWGWDLNAAWNSKEANSHRKKLRSCACIHGCNLSTAASHTLRQIGNHK